MSFSFARVSEVRHIWEPKSKPHQNILYYKMHEQFYLVFNFFDNFCIFVDLMFDILFLKIFIIHVCDAGLSDTNDRYEYEEFE